MAAATTEHLVLVYPTERPASPLKTVATWLFVLPIFTEGVLANVVKVEAAGLAVLFFASAVILRRSIPRLAIERIFATFAVLALLLIAHLALGTWPMEGTARSYDTHAVLFIVTYVEVAAFAVLFFEEDLFKRVMWRAATLALWIGVASCTASRLTGHLLLVNPDAGGLRMEGTLEEPAAWAGVLTFILLLALRRRSRLYVALAFAGLLLADSPTSLVVMSVTVPLYYALASKWRHRMLLLAALAFLIPIAMLFVQHADAQRYLDSRNPAEISVGRLISGIHNVETGGQEGTNSRFASTTTVIADARANGWMRMGAGLAADASYFPAKYPITRPTGRGTSVTPNALWVSVLFDLGVGGAAILGVLTIITAWRLRRYPEMTAILLPFLVASLVNSAASSYPLVALAIMLFAFRWNLSSIRTGATWSGSSQ